MKTDQWHGGKGSKPRPTDRDKFNEAFDRIFKTKEKETKRKPPANQELHS
jgi:hypothetical protein|tara:strand:+ start:1042 stop:1191 length:150 start_codon:yes stop_codon:yes gene_type:complete